MALLNFFQNFPRTVLAASYGLGASALTGTKPSAKEGY
jgi:hypothetical protein